MGEAGEPARLQPGPRVSFGALLLQSVTSSSRAARRSLPASPPARPPRPRAPPLGGLRKRRARRTADKPRPALRCGRRPRPRDTSGRRAPAAAAPRAGAVSQQNANARGGGGHTKRARPPQRSFASSPGRAGTRAESAAGGAPRRTARRRPWPPSCRCVGPGCWATWGWGSPFCAGLWGGGGYRPGGSGGAGLPSGDRRVPGLLSLREDHKMGSGAAPLPWIWAAREPSLSSWCPDPASLDFRWSPPGA